MKMRWILLLALLWGAEARSAGPAGMVLSVKGSVQLRAEGALSSPTPFSYLPLGGQVQVAEGAALTFTHYQNNEEFNLVGPASVELIATGVKVLSGKVVAPKKLKPETSRQLQPTQARYLVQGAVSMRAAGWQLAAPLPGELFLAAPEFVWTGVLPEASRLLVVDDNGIQVVDAVLEASPLRLVADWVAGQRYQFMIVALQGGKTLATGSFTLAAQSQKNELEKGRPADTAPKSDWVVYADQLYQKGARHASRQVLDRYLNQP